MSLTMLGRNGPTIGKWGRSVNANDTNAALTVNQRGSGDILDIQDGGVTVFKIPDGGGALYSDDKLFRLGTDGDQVLLNRSTVLNADTALASVLVGTVESQAIAANSLMIANATSNGDIALYTNKGGNSQMGVWLDGSAGDTALLAASGASVDHYIAGVKELDHATGAFAFQVATAISGLSSLAANALDGQTVTFVAKNTAGQTQTVAQITGNATVVNSTFDINKLNITGIVKIGENYIGFDATAAEGISIDTNGAVTISCPNFSETGTALLLKPAGGNPGVNRGLFIDFYTPTGGGAVAVTSRIAGQLSTGANDASDLRFSTHTGSALTEKWRISALGVWTSLSALPSNVDVLGAIIAGGGLAVGDVLNSWIDDASHGTGSTAMYIGNALILVGNGVNFGPGGVTSITVVNGQITAIS